MPTNAANFACSAVKLLHAAALCLALGAGAACAKPPVSAPAPAATQAAPADAFASVRARRLDMARAFAAQAAICAARRDTAHFAFHGCVDWHSAAHAAWALTAFQRVTGETTYAAQLDALLAPNLIAQELEFVRAAPDFEMPYGRAWFLRLAVEWRALHPDDHRLDALAAHVAASMRDFYAHNAPDPMQGEYANPSWALINLLLYARAAHDEALEDFVARQVNAHFMSPHCPLALEDEGFIAVCTTWAWLVSEVSSDEDFRAWFAEWNSGVQNLKPVTAYPSAHDYGRNFSRAWGLYHLAGKLGSDALRASYAAHVAAGFTPSERWRGAYMINGHWVAQFGMLAIEPLFDDANTP